MTSMASTSKPSSVAFSRTKGCFVAEMRPVVFQLCTVDAASFMASAIGRTPPNRSKRLRSHSMYEAVRVNRTLINDYFVQTVCDFFATKAR